MSEFKPINTQEEFDKAIQERLNRQKELLEKQYQGYEETRKKVEALASENAALKASIEESTNAAKKHEQTVSELNGKIAGYETASLRTKIALQHGIPHDLANRLMGDDEKSMIEDAKKMAELIGKTDTAPPLKNTEPHRGGTDNAYKSLLENLNLEGE